MSYHYRREENIDVILIFANITIPTHRLQLRAICSRAAWFLRSWLWSCLNLSPSSRSSYSQLWLHQLIFFISFKNKLILSNLRNSQAQKAEIEGNNVSIKVKKKWRLWSGGPGDKNVEPNI